MNHQPSTKLCIIIPCYNEAKIIESLILSARKEFPEATIVVIDDCSTDNSVELVRNAEAVALQLPVNLGIGGAIQTGIMYAERKGFEYLIRIDGDGQHPVSEMQKVLAPIIAGEADMSIGSRFFIDSQTMNHEPPTTYYQPSFKSTPIRRIGIHTFRFLNRLIIGQTITDSTSGFRAYNKKLIEYLAKNYPSFDYPEPEEITLLGMNGYRIKEVSVNMQEREHGSSSINMLKSIYYMIKVVFAILITASRPDNQTSTINNQQL
jgi:glycosyltransferase involved in cell wall biosynthesis